MIFNFVGDAFFICSMKVHNTVVKVLPVLSHIFNIVRFNNHLRKSFAIRQYARSSFDGFFL